MKKYILIFAGFLIFQATIASANDFMLPKTFSLDKNDLPPIEEPQKPAMQKTTTYIQLGKPAIDNSVLKPMEQNPQIVQINFKKPESKLTNISLAKLIRNFDYDYSTTFNCVITTLIQTGIELLNYDSSKGQIQARLDSGRKIFVLFLPSKEKLTHIRITPADGNYDFSAGIIEDIFNNIDKNLIK